ncbi:hypothetical protein [Cognatishimia sp.]|uniref:hypothetical protein n=1 Tax=Cognatishimia sp. TaxID=2211648 RepID=UPI003510F6D6|nr:hypothetical protein [Cognatishimia sp.]
MGKEVKIHCFSYPAGEPGFRVYGPRVDLIKVIPDTLEGSSLCSDLIIAAQLLTRFKDAELLLPYLPMSREDRAMDKNGYITSIGKDTLINQLFSGANKITTYDMHSSACIKTALHLIKDIKPEPEFDLTYEEFDPDIVIFPDGGAKDRYNYMLVDRADVVGYATKSRTDNGLKIHDVTCVCQPNSESPVNWRESFIDWIGMESNCKSEVKILVMDDICDGGATFIKLAEYLKEQCNIVRLNMALHVSHGIFSKGLDSLLEHYNHIYTTDSFCNFIEHEKLTRYKIFD